MDETAALLAFIDDDCKWTIQFSSVSMPWSNEVPVMHVEFCINSLFSIIIVVTIYFTREQSLCYDVSGLV